LVENGQDVTGLYLALSHRWGDAQVVRLTTQTLSEFKRGIALQSLPRTFMDAVIVTRRLGYRYLWIDSMCILQDSHGDWLEQSARMAEVYQNAACVIAAHGASDDDSGFLDEALEPTRLRCGIKHHWPKYSSYPRLIHPDAVSSPAISQLNKRVNPLPKAEFMFRADEISFETKLAQGSLYNRGWTFQELILAKRLLHFTRHQVFFEDASGVIGDHQGWIERSSGFRTWTHDFNDPAQWYHVVERYSRCSLTYESDRLPALAGLADMFGSQHNSGQYLYGLWSQSIHQGLLWTKTNFDTIRAVDAYTRPGPSLPTWSWAYWKSAVKYPRSLSGSRSLIKLIDIDDYVNVAALMGTDDRGAKLSIMCQLTMLSEVIAVEPLKSERTRDWRQGYLSYMANETTDIRYAAFDRESHLFFAEKLALMLVAVSEDTRPIDGEDNEDETRSSLIYYYLLLEETKDTNHYRRVGIGATASSTWWDGCDSVLVHLV
jgi:hypothetical protein